MQHENDDDSLFKYFNDFIILEHGQSTSRLWVKIPPTSWKFYSHVFMYLIFHITNTIIVIVWAGKLDLLCCVCSGSLLFCTSNEGLQNTMIIYFDLPFSSWICRLTIPIKMLTSKGLAAIRCWYEPGTQIHRRDNKITTIDIARHTTHAYLGQVVKKIIYWKHLLIYKFQLLDTKYGHKWTRCHVCCELLLLITLVNSIQHTTLFTCKLFYEFA